MHVLRYGSTRHQVLGVEAVFADGRVMRRLDGLEKDNTGYDLSGLLCGSEGTLAVITAARLRLVPRPTHVVVALLRLRRHRRRARRGRRAAPRPRLAPGGRAVLPGRARPRVRAARAGPALRGPPRRVRARGGRGAHRSRPPSSPPRSTRSPASPTSRSRPTTAPRVTSGATGKGTPKRSTCSARRTSSTSRCRPTELARFVSEVREQRRAGRARRRGLAVRPRGRRQHSRERDGCCS